MWLKLTSGLLNSGIKKDPMTSNQVAYLDQGKPRNQTIHYHQLQSTRSDSDLQHILAQ